MPPGPPGLPPVAADPNGRVHPPTTTPMPSDHAQALHGRSEQPVDPPPATPMIRGSLNLADSVKAKVPAGVFVANKYRIMALQKGVPAAAAPAASTAGNKAGTSKTQVKEKG